MNPSTRLRAHGHSSRRVAGFSLRRRLPQLRIAVASLPGESIFDKDAMMKPAIRLLAIFIVAAQLGTVAHSQIGRPLEPGADPLRDRWQVSPLRLDDELFIAANLVDGGMALGIAYPQPRTFEGDAPASLYRRFDDRTVIAGDAGRIMGVAFQQVALVIEDAQGTWLDVYSGLFPGQVHIGRHPLPPLCPDAGSVDCRLPGRIEVVVAELDGFDESRPDLTPRCLETNRRHDEVALAYPVRAADGNGGTVDVVQVEVLGWPGVVREAGTDASPTPPTLVVDAGRTNEIEEGQFRLLSAQIFRALLDGAGQVREFEDLYIAYLDDTLADGFEVVTEGFRLQRNLSSGCDLQSPLETSRIDFATFDGFVQGSPGVPVQDLGGPVPFDSPESWGIVAGQADEFGLLGSSLQGSQGLGNEDAFVSVWAETAQGGARTGLVEAQTVLLNTTGGSGMEVRSNSQAYAIAGRNGFGVDLLPNARLRLSVGRSRAFPDAPFGSACLAQAVYVTADTEFGPVVQAIWVGGESNGGVPAVGTVSNPGVVWPTSSEFGQRPLTGQRANITVASGGFMRNRDRPELTGPECESLDLWEGDAESFYVAEPDAPGIEAVNITEIGAAGDLEPVSPFADIRPLALLGLPDHRSTVGPDFVSVNMDIDGNGATDAATDGQLIVRFLMGLRGADITDGGALVAPDCVRCTDIEIEDYLVANHAAYDADADGRADGLSDGLQRLRFMLSRDGLALTQGVVAPGCKRCTANELIAYFLGPLDRPVLDLPVMLAFDADGNAPHYRRGQAFFTEGADYRVRNVEAFDVILAEPPKHVDWLPALGGITNISATADLFAAFETQTTSSQNVSKETVSDWTLSESERITRTASAGVDLFGAVKASVEGSVSTATESEFNETSGNFTNEQTSLSITQISTAERDDQVVSRIMDLHVWRYPVMGLRNADGTQANPRFFEIHQPTPSLTFFSGGRTNDAYQPWHTNNNLLSYPVFTGQSFTPANDEVGEFAVGSSLPSARPIWSESAFTVGGLTFSQTLEFTETTGSEQTLATSDTVTESRDTSVKASVEVGGSFKGIGVSASASEERNWSASESFSYADTNITGNELSDRTRIQLSIPGDIPGERGYRFHPAWFFTPDGGLKLTHAVALEGMGVVPETFWQTHYSAPDPALNMPFRFSLNALGSNTFVLNTDPSRQAVKGMFFRDGRGIDPDSAGERRGTDLSFAPLAGEPVQIELRVYNLSLATPVENLAVKFEAQRFELGQEIGPRIAIGETVIDEVPYRGQITPDPAQPLSELAHVKTTYMVWDTLDFGPDDPGSLATWRIYVTLDPDDEIADEVHELVDRFDDPLLDVFGDPVDPLPGEVGVWLEKGQNNTGWGLLRIAAAEQPAGGTRAAASPASLIVDLQPVDANGGRATEPTVRVGRPVDLRLTLGTDRVVRDTFRILVYDGPPEHGRLLTYRRVTGLSPDGFDQHLRWIPETAGRQDLHLVTVDESRAGMPRKVDHGAILTIDVQEAK